MFTRALGMLISSGVAALSVVAGFVLFYVRPFEPPPALSNEALARSWNESINHLGISPVYPPQEDLRVGDVLAVVVGAGSAPLLARAIRLAHIDMRDLILKEQRDQLPFADTVVAGAGGLAGQHDRLAVAAPVDRVALTLVAFPGFKVRYSAGASASASASRWRLGGSRQDEEVEEITIPVAETYGVSQASAVERLQDWCNGENHREGVHSHCNGEFARSVLQFALGDDAFATAPGVAKPHVELLLVTRVYLMRAVDQRRTSASNRTATAAGLLGAAGPAVASSDRTPADDPSGAPRTADATAAGATSANSTVSRMASTEIALRRSFQRPLVFGYRSVRAKLP